LLDDSVLECAVVYEVTRLVQRPCALALEMAVHELAPRAHGTLAEEVACKNHLARSVLGVVRPHALVAEWMTLRTEARQMGDGSTEAPHVERDASFDEREHHHSAGRIFSISCSPHLLPHELTRSCPKVPCLRRDEYTCREAVESSQRDEPAASRVLRELTSLVIHSALLSRSSLTVTLVIDVLAGVARPAVVVGRADACEGTTARRRGVSHAVYIQRLKRPCLLALE
jgi:hypothetical protein